MSLIKHVPCFSSNIPVRKSNTWDIHNLIHHDLIHDTYFRNKIPIVWYHYYTCNVQIVFSSIITLIAINYSFLFPCFFFFLHSRWYLEVLCGNVTFLSDSQKYNGSWLAICSNCRYQYGLTNLVQLLHLSCLGRSSLIFNLQDWKVEHSKSSLFQVREKALIAIVSGFWIRYISIQLLINSSSKDIFNGFPNFSTILWKRAGLSFHSVASASALDCLSASILIVTGICAAATHY